MARSTTLDLATDWSVYVINRLAARQLLDMGVSRFALSPEDGIDNVPTLLAEFGPQAVLIVYQDTPLFLARVVRLRQPDRRLSRQGELQIREHGDGVEPRRAGDRSRLSLPDDRAQPRGLLPVAAARRTELLAERRHCVRISFIEIMIRRSCAALRAPCVPAKASQAATRRISRRACCEIISS